MPKPNVTNWTKNVLNCTKPQRDGNDYFLKRANKASFFLELMKYTPLSKTMAATMDCSEMDSFKKYQPNNMATIGLT